jgi:hypothetical protein
MSTEKEAYTVHESVAVGHRQFWERRIYKKPFPTKELAIKACNKKEKSDNQPFVQDTKGFVVYTGKPGHDYQESK